MFPPYLEIPEIMKNPKDLDALVLDPSERNPDPFVPGSYFWNPLSLSDGYPGILLYFSTLQNKGLLKDKDEQIVHSYVVKIIETIEAQGLSNNLSLFTGVSGICFAIQSASMEGKRYGRFLNTLQIFLLNEIGSSYLEPLKKNIRFNRTSSSSFYDLIQGISGIGRYAIENLSDPRFSDLSVEIVKTLSAYIKPLNIDGQQVPGWFLSSTDVLNIHGKTNVSKGSFNLGLAHGVPGILSILSIAALKGVLVDGQREAIVTAADWLRKKCLFDNGTIRWPHSISWEDEFLQQSPSSHKGCYRDAWCYGSPGVIRSLFLAGKALSDQDLKIFAAKAFRDIFFRTRQDWYLPGPSICHGLAGLLLITKEMAQEKECTGFFSNIDMLTQLLISDYNRDYPFGFKDVEICRNGSYVKLNKPGLLEGAVGVMLTLLTLKDFKSKWQLPFLIHD